MTQAEVPPHLNSEYCLRCMTPFEHGQTIALIGPTPASNRDVYIEVCRDCYYPEHGDSQRFFSVYIRNVMALPLANSGLMLPRFTSNRPIAGFLRASLLDNGLWRIGLIRGFPELWSRREIEDIGRPRKGDPVYGYSEHYDLFGPLKVLGAGAHTIVKVGFIDLSKPWKVLPLGQRDQPDPGQYFDA